MHQPRPSFGNYLLLIFILAMAAQSGYAQQNTISAATLVNITEAYQARRPLEKVYLHLDRPSYAKGDTIWFKAYLMNAAALTESKISGKLYVELLTDSNRVVNRFAVPIYGGLGQGDIVLDDKIDDGTYTVRAYTNWMQNFGEETFFSQRFIVGETAMENNWLVNEQHSLQKSADGNMVNLNLQLTDISRQPVAYRDVEVKLVDGKRTLLRSNQTSADNGRLSSAFKLPANANPRNLSLILTDKVTKKQLTFPFYPGGALSDVDLQFMPEGGSMVNGLPSRVAFKAIAEDGLGINISGTIVNTATGEEVNTFTADHKGMGSFMLLPTAGQTYQARFMLQGIAKTVALPVARPSGINIRVDNLSNRDSVNIYIKATADVAAIKKTYTLLARAAGSVYFGVPVNLSSGYQNLRLPKSSFNTGIVCFTLADGNLPLAERRIFIDQHDGFRIAITNSQPQYQPKDSVSLAVAVTDVNGKPVQGSFSVAVTDDAFVRNTDNTPNISSHMLLSAEVKGNVEDAAWYFAASDAMHERALDNLLLAQAWTGFSLAIADLAPAKPVFDAEPDNRLSGTLSGLFKRPLKGAIVNIFASSKKNGIILMDTMSNERGEFLFDNLPVVDSIAYVIKLKNKKNKEMGANITLNEFTSAPVTLNDHIRPVPWYLQADTAMLGYIKQPRRYALSGLDKRDVKGKLLNEVVIRAKQKQTMLVHRQWGYVDREITEKEFLAAKQKSLYEIMRDKLAAMRESYIWRASSYGRSGMHQYLDYVIGTDLIADFVIDGQYTRQVFGSDMQRDSAASYRSYINGFLNNLGADDLKNVKIVKGFNLFVVITTRSGKGIGARAVPGTIAYHPVPYNMPRQFYRPKYTPQSKPDTDPRATIHWEPNLVTDNDGKAILSFYAAEKASSYTINLQGTDMNGGLGYQTAKVTVVAGATSVRDTNIKPTGK